MYKWVLPFSIVLFLVMVSFRVTANPIEEIVVVGSKKSTGYSDPEYHDTAIQAIKPTMVYQAGGPGGFTGVSLNGTDSKHTLVYRNGVPVNDPSSGWYDLGTEVPTRQTYEVYSGSNGALFGSSSMAGTVFIEDTFDKHVFYKGGDRLQFISGGNEWFQISRYKGSIGSVMTTNSEEDWFENTTLKTKAKYGGFDVVMVSQDYDYDYDDCLYGSSIEYNDCNQSGYKVDISIKRDDWLTLGYNVNSAQYNLGSGTKSNRIYVDTKRQLTKNLLIGVTGQQEQYDFYFRSPVPITHKDNRTGIYTSWTKLSENYNVGLGYRYEDEKHIFRLGTEIKDVKFQIANSFRSPNLYEIFGDDYVQPNHNLKAEESKGIEISYKKLSLFRYEFSEGIDYDFNNRQYINTGSYNSQGIKYKYTREGFVFSASYTDSDIIRKAKYKTLISYFGMFGKIDYQLSYVGEFDRGLDFDGRPIDNISTFQFNLGYYLSPDYRVGLHMRDVLNRNFEILPGYAAGGREIFITFNLSI